MATNQSPAMKHRVVSTDTSGEQRTVPCANQWSAEAEAKRRIARGHTDVIVESWDSKTNAFQFNVTANNHLQTQDKRAEVNEDAIESLGKLAASQRQAYKVASNGKMTQTEMEAFIDELRDLASLLENTNELSYR